jgi:hypothetical protein
LSEGTEENERISVRIAGVLIDIRTKHLLNIILKCYPCNNLVCPKSTDGIVTLGQVMQHILVTMLKPLK